MTIQKRTVALMKCGGLFSLLITPLYRIGIFTFISDSG